MLTVATSLRDRLRDLLRGRWGWVAGGLVVLGALVLLLYPYGSAPDETGGTAARDVATLRGAYLTPSAGYSSDPLLQGRTTPLVVAAPSSGARGAVVRVLAGDRTTVTRRVALPGDVRDAALARWSDDEPALASLRRRGATLQVTAASLDTGRLLTDERVPVTLLRRRSALWRLAPWAGSASDLFVLAWPPPGSGDVADRATGVRPVPRLLVLDGDTGFRRVELTAQLPLTARAPAEWTLLVARVSGPVPDLLLVRRPPDARAEVHVLSGESQFRQFILHQRLDLPSRLAGRSRFVPALVAGRPVLRAIEPGAGRATVRSFPLGSVPPGA